MSFRASNTYLQSWQEQSSKEGFYMKKVSNLAAPRGVKYICELTGALATIAIVSPNGELYFASKKDAILAWEGVLHKVLDLVLMTKRKTPFIGLAIDREALELEQENLRKDLIEICYNHGKLQVERESTKKLSLPSAIYALKLAKKEFGQDNSKCVKIYLLLGKIYSALKHPGKAHEYLSLAKWCCMRTKVTDPRLLRSLYEDTGKIFFVQNMFSEAIENFSQAIYYASVFSNSSIDPEIIPSLENLAQAFEKMSETSSDAESMNKIAFSKKAESIYKFSISILEGKTNQVSQTCDGRGLKDLKETLETLKQKN